MYIAYTIKKNHKAVYSGVHKTREDAARELFTTMPDLKACETAVAMASTATPGHWFSGGQDVQSITRIDVFAPKKDSVEQTADALDAIKAKLGHPDTARALTAAQAIVGGRTGEDAAAVMVTLEHAVATVLIALYGDPYLAVVMLNEGLVQGVEARLAFYGSKDKRDA
jgi:hypothetical protein